MQTTFSDNNWFKNNNSVHRQTIAFVLSVIIMLLLLMLPIRQYKGLIESNHTIKLELFKSNPKDMKKPLEYNAKQVDKVIQSKDPLNSEPKIGQDPQPQTQKPVKEINKKEQKPIVVVSTPKLVVNKDGKANKILPSSGIILNSAFNGIYKDFEVGSDFQAKTDEQDDFVFRKVEPPKWNKVHKLINEEIDKPQYEMNFYAIGLEGTVERFMDKITYKKRFTTRYGTKIDCAAVAYVLVVCGWK